MEEQGNKITKVNTKMVQTLKDWFEIDITIKLLGVEIVHWTYPKDK